MLGIFDLGITSKNGYNIKECGIFGLGITLKNVVNDFFFLFFQFIILDAIIFLLFLLNEKFCHLISKHPFVLILFLQLQVVVIVVYCSKYIILL